MQILFQHTFVHTAGACQLPSCLASQRLAASLLPRQSLLFISPGVIGVYGNEAVAIGRMPTWKLISDGGNSYRWVISGDIGAQLPEGASFDDAPFVKDDNSWTSLTSVEDLLLQCSTELKENSTDERVPKFQTALGKAISVKESSVLKALSFMAENERLDTCQEQGGRNGFVCSGPFFQTGAGKRVDVSAAGLMRAKKLLGLENESFMNESFCKAGNNTIVGRASNFSEKESEIRATHDFMQPQMQNNFINPTSIKFQTAGGKSVSVSSDALQRARSLLEDLEVETPRDAEEESESFLFTEGKSHTPTIHINDTYVKISSEEAPKGKCFLKRGSSFLPSLMPLQKPINHSQDRKCTNIVIECDNNHNSLSFKNPSRNVPALENEFSGQNIVTRGQSPVKSIAYPPLSDISNIKPGDLRSMNFKPLNGKRMLGGKSSISTFKRPRNCRFSSANTSSFIVNGDHAEICLKRRVFAKYPFLHTRASLKEYFCTSPMTRHMVVIVADEIKKMNALNAENHRFYDECIGSIGVGDFNKLLLLDGVSMDYISKEWISNHYKWIVWKLASYERSYPVMFSGRLLNLPNVVEELKYRYDREIIFGHRSAIRKILDGDVSPLSVMVLCVSAIHPQSPGSNVVSEKVELTDGWYCIDAVLDKLLSKKLFQGKLYVGQKLRICGARLCGWDGSISPLEEERKGAALMLHMNGTHRAHWAEPLGLCKGLYIPLAFKCIKSGGGLVRQTIVGIKRVYPVLYKERLSSGETIIIPERLKIKAMQMLNERRWAVIEEATSGFEMRGRNYRDVDDDDDDGFGGKMMKMLEDAAEPEILMAEMSSEQLNSFASYRAKVEEVRQGELKKSVERALYDAGLCQRDCTPFIRLRAVGLTAQPPIREGAITIWNPSHQQLCEIVEGEAYAVSELVPLDTQQRDELYLHTKGSVSRWEKLSPSTLQNFRPFHHPRRAVSLAHLGDVPLSSEFDVAGLIVHVGEAYQGGECQTRQWVFVADNSSMIAIHFCMPCVGMRDNEPPPVGLRLVRSVVGFLNLVKRPKDMLNQVWVAEATLYSQFHLASDLPSHLKLAARSVHNWANSSHLTVEELRRKAQLMIGRH